MLMNRLKLDWRYAIGEISLIAIGVLIALAVDGWADYRAERKLEMEYIGRIEEDLQSTLEIWAGHTARLESAIGFLQGLRDGGSDMVNPDNVEDIWNAYMISHWYQAPAIRSSAFEELVSTGRLSIIGDVELRGEIADFFTSYSAIADSGSRMVDQSYNHVSRAAVSYEVFHSAQNLKEFDVSEIRAAFDDLRARPDFNELSNAQLTVHSSNIQFMRMYTNYAESLLDELEAYGDE